MARWRYIQVGESQLNTGTPEYSYLCSLLFLININTNSIMLTNPRSEHSNQLRANLEAIPQLLPSNKYLQINVNYFDILQSYPSRCTQVHHYNLFVTYSIAEVLVRTYLCSCCCCSSRNLSFLLLR